jgi:hypothetical protein
MVRVQPTPAKGLISGKLNYNLHQTHNLCVVKVPYDCNLNNTRPAHRVRWIKSSHSEAAAILFDLRCRGSPRCMTTPRLRQLEQSLCVTNTDPQPWLWIKTARPSILRSFRWASWVPTKQRAPGDSANRSAWNNHLRDRNRAFA